MEISTHNRSYFGYAVKIGGRGLSLFKVHDLPNGVKMAWGKLIDIKFNFLNRFIDTGDRVDKREVVLSVLKRRGYVEQVYKGGSLNVKGFTYVLVTDSTIEVGNDAKCNGTSVDINNLTGFMIALKYFERI